uniref:Histone-lysine N-methyltransferase, H3 lysine-36 specific n=1 Tax=Mycena chlorophos TaxID=658473 RepID=A0ABQ0LYB6_MYCCL|nr:histone methyltransferase [Mycena chlorophos]
MKVKSKCFGSVIFQDEPAISTPPLIYPAKRPDSGFPPTPGACAYHVHLGTTVLQCPLYVSLNLPSTPMALVKAEETPTAAVKPEPVDVKPSLLPRDSVGKVEEGAGAVKADEGMEDTKPPPQTLASPVTDPAALFKDEGDDVTMPPPPSAEPDTPSPSSPSDSVAGPSSRSKSRSKSASTAQSRSTTPPVASTSRSSKKKAPMPVQLIGDLPIARDAALATFTEIAANTYQNKSLGRSREALEGMSCECAFTRAYAPGRPTCGADDNCINRLTLIECLDDCRGGIYCENQRFQRKQYASIDIVQTEKKGFGLRAEADIPKDGFIYEYVGEVVNPNSFKKRMRDYADEGIEHFYFMMLQKDEFIDATKCGGIGRFANHSCNPNCYVAKWTIGSFVRMGIFAKRKIQKNEELTFNYNVDRYGFKAQDCYCGEPNCVGFLGGKTQTDIAAVDDLYLDALGITDEDDIIALKGSKKKKGKKIDDEDFAPTLSAITVAQLPKIIAALRQAPSRHFVVKLLTRFSMTTEEGTLREMLRLRCMTLMKQLLDDHYPKNLDIITTIIGFLRFWPLTTRNKVDMCRINESVQKIADEVENEKLRDSAKELVAHWETLPMGYRIPKRTVTGEEKTDEWEQAQTLLPTPAADLRDLYYAPKTSFNHRPRGWDRDGTLSGRGGQGYQFADAGPSYEELPASERSRRTEADSKREAEAMIAAVLAKQAADDAAAAAAAEAEKARKEKKGKEREKRKHRSSSSKKSSATQTPEEREANKNKRLLKLVGAVVVKSMSKYGKGLERDKFKKHAKELTQIIADKEKKSSSYRDNKLDTLSDEKVAKIKKFSKEYIAKVMRKMEKSNSHKPSSSTPLTSTSSTLDTPNSNSADNADADGDIDMPEMTVEEAMDMDPASGSDDDSDGDEDEDENRQETRDIDMRDVDADPSPKAHGGSSPADPRRRPPDGGENGANGHDAWGHPPLSRADAPIVA